MCCFYYPFLPTALNIYTHWLVYIYTSVSSWYQSFKLLTSAFFQPKTTFFRWQILSVIKTNIWHSPVSDESTHRVQKLVPTRQNSSNTLPQIQPVRRRQTQRTPIKPLNPVNHHISVSSKRRKNHLPSSVKFLIRGYKPMICWSLLGNISYFTNILFI